MIFRHFVLIHWLLFSGCFGQNILTGDNKIVTAFEALRYQKVGTNQNVEDVAHDSDRVYLGDLTDPYPFMVTVAAVDSNGTVAETICGASLIDANNILTAEHCIGMYDQWRNRAGYTLEAWIGTNDLREAKRNWQRVPLAATAVRAPNADMAIQKLAKPVRFTQVNGELPSAAICIGLYTKTTGVESRLIGYGWTDCPNPNVDGRLHTAAGKVYGYSDRSAIYAIVYNSKGKQASGIYGDSGSPAFTVKGNVPVQVAVVTNIRTCGTNRCPCSDGNANTYGVKPGYFKSWIQQNAPGAKFCQV